MVSLTEKKASLNGNISSIIWRDSTQTASRGYRFTYDQMNRLTDAVYGEGPSLSENTDRYSERGMTYTKNGALTRLLRYGRRNTDDFGLVDSLVMTLDGNRVLSVEDSAGSLVYENSFDFKGSVRLVVSADGQVIERNDYYPSGCLITENIDGETVILPYKYNGKELDPMHGLYTYDYGARQYDPATMLWDRMDPLCEKYYNVSPYVYCGDNPVRLIDIYGLYPDFLLSFHKSPFYRADYYTLNLPAVRLMSLVSGISEEYIRKVQIMQRGFGHYYPLYSPDNGGGAITLGNTPDNVSISFTPNFFEDNKAKYSGHGYGQDFYRWMYLLSHEVTHIKHIKKCRNEILYIGSFLKDYIEYGHDNTPREKEADEGMKEFNDFNTFINNNIGNNALEKLFKSVKSDSQKINTINLWWKIYDGKKKEHNLFE